MPKNDTDTLGDVHVTPSQLSGAPHFDLSDPAFLVSVRGAAPVGPARCDLPPGWVTVLGIAIAPPAAPPLDQAPTLLVPPPQRKSAIVPRSAVSSLEGAVEDISTGTPRCGGTAGADDAARDTAVATPAPTSTELVPLGCALPPSDEASAAPAPRLLSPPDRDLSGTPMSNEPLRRYVPGPDGAPRLVKPPAGVSTDPLIGHDLDPYQPMYGHPPGPWNPDKTWVESRALTDEEMNARRARHAAHANTPFACASTHFTRSLIYVSTNIPPPSTPRRSMFTQPTTDMRLRWRRNRRPLPRD